MNTEDIKHLAHLARIKVTDTEAGELQQDIEAVLDYVGVLGEITADSDTTKRVGAVHNVMRPDVVTTESSACTEALLAEAPDRKDNLLKVKKILHND